MISQSLQSSDPIIVCRATLLNEMFNVLKKDGIVLTTKYLELFKDDLQKLGLEMKKVIGNVNNFKKSIDRIMSLKKYSSYSEAPKPGKIYYDASIFSSALYI